MAVRRFHGHPALRVLGLLALGAALAVVVWYPMFDLYPNTPEGDGRTFLRIFNAIKAAPRIHHELPLWNPYDCGGSPLWDDPESMAASPFMFLTTRLSATKTMYVWNIVHLSIGFCGMWLFSRRELGLSYTATFATACIYTFSVCHTGQYAGGHVALISFLDVPLALYFWRGAEKSANEAIGLGLLVALMFYDGATYPIPHTALVLAAETLTRMWPWRRMLRILKAAVITLVVALTAGAARVLPLIDQFTSKHRVIAPDADHLLRWNTLKAMYTWREVHWWFRLPEQAYVWGEYLAYTGMTLLVLCAIGMLVSGRRYLWMTALALFVFSVMLGHFAEYAPWSFLNHHVFPFKSMRVSARFRLIVCLFIAAYVGIAIDRVPAIVRRFMGLRISKMARTLICGIAFIGAGDMMGVSGELVATRFGGAPEKHVKPSTRLFYEGADIAQDIDQPLQNRGRLGCSLAWAFSQGAATWGGDVPQARSTDEKILHVQVANRTQNTFTIDYVSVNGGRITLNSGFERGWETDLGTLSNQADLLTLDVPPGERTVHVRYVPWGLRPGAALTAFSFLCALLFFARHRLRALFRRKPKWVGVPA